jgi:hypothetical protein
MHTAGDGDVALQEGTRTEDARAVSCAGETRCPPNPRFCALLLAKHELALPRVIDDLRGGRRQEKDKRAPPGEQHEGDTTFHEHTTGACGGDGSA